MGSALWIAGAAAAAGLGDDPVVPEPLGLDDGAAAALFPAFPPWAGAAAD